MMNPARAGCKVLLVLYCLLFVLLSWNTGAVEGSSIPSPPTPISPNGGNYEDQVTFTWSHPEHGSDNIYYELQVDTNPSFSGGIFMFLRTSNIQATEYTKVGFPNDGTRFYWRVRAFKTGPGWSNWSTTRYFDNGKPSPPELLFPGTGQVVGTDDTGEITFFWWTDPDVTMYRLQVAKNYDPDFVIGDEFFGEIVHEKNIAVEEGDLQSAYMTETLDGFPNDGTKYYWRMRSFKPNVYWGEWSEAKHFYNGTIPPPNITEPEQGAYQDSSSVTIKWEGVDSSNGYQLQYSTSSSFYGVSEIFIHDYLDSYNISNLPQTGQTYYYRMRARHWEGNRWGNWSEARTFINGPPPPEPPVLTSPLSLPGEDTIIAYPSVHFKWEESTGATRYQLQVSASEDFSPTLINDTNVTGTEITKTGFPNDGTTYYWRVAANNNFGWSAWSEVGSFVNGYDYDTGSLRVFIEPKDARRAGAQWSLVIEDQEPDWKNSGETIENLAVNDGSDDIKYTVEFKAVESWTKPDNISSLNLSTNLTTAVTGYYTPSTPEYTVKLSVNPVVSGKVNGEDSLEQTYEAGTRVTVTATAEEDYYFVGWTENGRVVSTKASYRFNVESDRDLVANFQTDATPTTVDVTLTANPEEGGTVKGGGTYLEGDIVVVTASANRGYSFINWTEKVEEDAVVVSTSERLTFIMGDSDRDLVANFQEPPTLVDVTLTADPEEGGTVQGGGTYLEGDLVVVTASANKGYSFFSWTDETDKVVSYSESYSFTIGSVPRELVANFQADEPQTYSVAVFAEPPFGGSVEGGGTYQPGTRVTVAATPANGYSFVSWTEGTEVVSRKANYTFTMGSSNRRLVANFEADEPETYSVFVTADPPEVGRVAGGGDYKPGARVTVTATPDSGYSFVSWTEFVGGREVVVSEIEKYTFTMEYSDRYLVANFRIDDAPSYSVTVSANNDDYGTVQGGGENILLGELVTVIATANESYEFVSWTEKVGEDDVVVSTNAEYTFKMGSANRYLVANFQEATGPEMFTISVSADPTEGGKVHFGNGATSPQFYEFGDKATAYADADVENGYEFVSWTENGKFVSGRATYSFVVDADRDLVANFHSNDDPTFTVSLTVNPEGYGIVKGGGSYKPGELVTIMAAASEGCEFVSWTEEVEIDGKTVVVVVSANEKYTFKMESADRDLVANFRKVDEPEIFAVAVSASPPEGGKVSGGGNYENGTEVTVYSAAATGYIFVNWTEGGTVVSSSADYTFTVESNRKLVANFEKEIIQTSYTVYLYVDPEEGGTVRGGGDYEPGTRVTVSARANKGYTFHYWADGTGVVSKDERYTFIMGKSDVKLVAYFRLAQ